MKESYVSNAMCRCLLVLAFVGVVASETSQLETPRLGERDQRKEFSLLGQTSAFKFSFADAKGAATVSNAAAMQLQMDKSGNTFLPTLPITGAAQFLTVLKPCGLILPHTHQRATEFYTVLAGTMSAGVAQENGAAQNITFTVAPGEVFVVPQNLLHYNHNRQCTANAFLQTFNSADPGAVNMVAALAAFTSAGPDGASALRASAADGVRGSAQLAFALDQDCLAACKLPAGGAPGDGLDTLPDAIRALFDGASTAESASSGASQFTAPRSLLLAAAGITLAAAALA